MTITQMHTKFDFLFDKMATFSAPELSPADKDLILNIAQDDLIESLTKKGVEKNQEYTDYLKNIIVPYFSTSFFTDGFSKPNGVYVQLPSDYRTSVLEYVDIEYLNCKNVLTSKKTQIKPITRDYYNITQKDPFNSPWKEEVHRIAVGLKQDDPRNPYRESFELISPNTITKYYLDYIKNPRAMNFSALTDCELGEKAQNKIIELGVFNSIKILKPELLEADVLHQKTKTEYI